MSCLGTQFDGHEWHVRIPHLVRYVGQQRYVDEFFDKGRLRLSSLQAFRAYEGDDGERGDWSEGRFHGRVGNMAISAMHGETAYILCTCAVENEQMDANFDTHAGFRIVEALEFAHSVSKQLPGFLGGVQGLCSYRNNKFDQRSEPLVEFDERAPEESVAAFERVAHKKMLEALFIKDLKFAYQVEHRFIWRSSAPQEKYLEVVCPDARQFCRRSFLVPWAASPFG